MKTKTKVISTIVLIALLAGFYTFHTKFMAWADEMNNQTFTAVATSTPVKAPTRLEQVQDTINRLAEARKKDQTFIDETNKEIESLKRSRETQARLDALMIVKTQLDVEIANIDSQNK